MKHENIQVHDVKDKSLILLSNSFPQALQVATHYLTDWVEDAIPNAKLIVDYSFKEAYTLPKTNREPIIKLERIAKVYWLNGQDHSHHNLWIVNYLIV